MKEFKIYYTEEGTVYNYCKAWVKAKTQEEAIKALKDNDWDKILNIDTYDSDYDDCYISEIETVEDLVEYEDQ